MANSGDKFDSLITPNCQRTASKEDKLQSCPFARKPKFSPYDIHSASSSDDSSELATGIEILTLPESSDEYHTPPDHNSSQNSSNDGLIPPTKAFDRDGKAAGEAPTVVPADDGGGLKGKVVVDLTSEEDGSGLVEKSNAYQVLVEMSQREKGTGNAHQVFVEMSQREKETGNAHQVFVEMSQREKEKETGKGHQVFEEMSQRVKETGNKEKRKLPFSLKPQKPNSNESRREPFRSCVERFLKMTAEQKKRDRGEEADDGDTDFLEIAKARGLTLPRPRWWPEQGFGD